MSAFLEFTDTGRRERHQASERQETWSRRGERELGRVEAVGEGAMPSTAVVEVLPSQWAPQLP